MHFKLKPNIRRKNVKKRSAILILSVLMFSVSLFAAPKADSMSKGKKLYASKKYEQAYSAFEKAAEANPKSAEAYMYMGYCRMALKDKEGAIRDLEKSISIKANPGLKKYVDGLKGKKGSGPAGSAQAGGTYYYTGGEDRAMALGNPRIVLRDASAALDIYGGAGITAGLALRPKKSFALINADFYNNSYKMVTDGFLATTTDGGVGTISAGGDPKRDLNAVTYWLTDNDVVSAKLGYARFSAPMKTVTTFITLEMNTSGNVLSGNVEYSRKIMKGLTAGVIAGYNAGWFDDEPDTASGVTLDTSVENKVNWGISAAYSPELDFGKLSAGLAVGSMDTLTKGGYFAMWEQSLSSPPDDYLDLNSTDTHQIVQFGGMSMDTKGRISVSGVNTCLMASFEKGSLEILAGFGLTAGVKGNRTGETITTIIATGTSNTNTMTPYDCVQDGSEFSAIVNGRYGLGMFEIGLAIRANSGGYKMLASAGDTDPVTRSVGAFNLTGGTAIKLNASMLIPVEITYDGSGYSDKDSGGTDTNSYSTVIMKGGFEYKLNPALALRAGLSYEMNSHTWNSGGTAGPASGTDDNPANNRLGTFIGAGYLLNKIQLDAFFSYMSQGRSPLGNNVTTYTASSLIAGLSANIPL